MSKYQDLLRVLNSLCEEAPASLSLYHPNETDTPNVEQARSHAYIHLFLKSKFGILSFVEREKFITDGSADGGIDAYYIDKEHRRIYLIQSKFRNSDSNFEGKAISYSELLAMDVDRITKGERSNEDGEPYNPSILSMLDELQSIDDLGRYDYVVIILANIQDKAKNNLTRLIGSFESEIYDHERVYEQILFPIVTGTFYDPKELKIVLNISKDSAGHRIQYYPETEFGECTVNACYVPTIEIAKTLYKYKNAILKFNPRSYLELKKGSVNEEIAKSITSKATNEFALFNNGITMLSDETEYSDRVGRKNTAELHLSNPQIINGGQTAYTLSRLYEDAVKNDTLSMFDGKEVLLKVISFNDGDQKLTKNQISQKLRLIEQISVATNQQSPVSEADRRANDKVQVELQQKIFSDFGLYYERKRGEFSDGLQKGYILPNQIIDREEFLRCRIAIDNPISARRTGAGILFSKERFDALLATSDNYRKCVFAYSVFGKMNRELLDTEGVKQYAKYAVVYVCCKMFDENIPVDEYNAKVDEFVLMVLKQWADFEKYAMSISVNQRFYFREKSDDGVTKQVDANWQGYYKGRTLSADLDAYFGRSTKKDEMVGLFENSDVSK